MDHYDRIEGELKAMGIDVDARKIPKKSSDVEDALELLETVIWGIEEAEKALDNEGEWEGEPIEERVYLASKRITESLDAARSMRIQLGGESDGAATEEMGAKDMQVRGRDAVRE